MAWKWNRLFASPFKRGGCVPTAFATVSDRPTAKHALELARKAPSFNWNDGSAFGLHMFRRGDGTVYHGRVYFWAGISGLRVLEDYVPEYFYGEQTFYRRDQWGYESRVERRVIKGLPTLAAFLRGKGKSGRWVAFTCDHAIAVIDGVAYGAYQVRSRIECAIRVEPRPTQP